VAPAEVPRIGEALGALSLNSRYEREWQLRRKDGSLVSAEVIATQMPDGNLMGVIRDITQRRHAEQALREQEAQFRTMANSIPQLAWVAKADGFITWYNDRWYEYTGTHTRASRGMALAAGA